MATFGLRCDAVTKSGHRCKLSNSWEIPCCAVYDARCTSYRADEFKPVRLCWGHWKLSERLRAKNKRLKLHHCGWLGPYNRYGFGEIVIKNESVNWDKIKKLQVPKYWAKKES